MNTRSLRFRLTAWYGSLLVVLGLAFGAYCYWRLDHFLSLYLTEIFSHRAERIADTLLANIERNGEAYVGKEIETRYAPEANDRFIRVTNSDGAVIYVSGEPNDQSFDPKKVPRPPGTHFVASTRIEDAGRSGLLIATVPFASSQQIYMIEVGGSTLPIKDVLRRFLVSLFVGLIVVLVLAIWGGFMVIKWALAPVKRITSTAEEITLHHLDKRLPIVETGDKIASLSKTLNQMISRLDESFQSVNRFTADRATSIDTLNVSAFTRMSASIFTAASKGSTEPSGSRPRFEGAFWGNGGIERIHAEAGGWPHLVQLVAETVVDLLNDEGKSAHFPSVGHTQHAAQRTSTDRHSKQP
jgi:HAMP domain-containing protein